MSERKLRYSERKLLAETGGPAALGDVPTNPLRNAMVHLLTEAGRTPGGKPFGLALQDECVKYFGWPPNRMSAELGFMRFETEPFLDLVELFAEKASEKFKVWHARNNWQWRGVLPGVEGEVKELFERHRFGYRLEGGEIRKISSPALEETVVGPALLAVARPGWEEAERSFREALAHQRGGEEENDDALTAANAALEAALKAAGFAGTHLGPLARDFKSRAPVPPELAGVPNALDTLLKRPGALRNTLGDSHGKEAGAPPVPDELVDLAVNWTGAFIVFLSRAIPT